MKISKKYIKINLLLVLLIALFPVCSFAQVVYKGVNSAIAKGIALGKDVNDNSNSGTTIVKTDDTPTQIIFPMIGLAKTVGVPVIQANGTFNVTYTLRVQNYSTIALENVQIVDDLKSVFPDNATNAKFTILPAAVSVVTPNATNGTGAITVNPAFNGDTDKNLLISSTSALTSNASGTAYFATIRFTINVDLKGIAAAYNKAYNNNATTSAETIISPDAPTVVTVTDISNNTTIPNNNEVNKTPLELNTPTPITLTGSDIEISKTVPLAQLTPDVNTNITFTIKVKNNGPATAAPVVVNDILPAGFEYVSKTVSGSTTFNEVTGVWSVGTLLVGSINEQTLTITAKVLPNKSAALYINTAIVNHPGDQNNTNDTAKVTITPKKVADLKIINSDGKLTYTPGTTNKYIIVVTNDGVSDVTGAIVRNTLPVGFIGTWTAVYDGGATGNTNGTNSISELVNMPVGSTITYEFIVTVPSGNTGLYRNTAEVIAPLGVTDPTPANNITNDDDTQNSEVDLEVLKVADSMNPVVNGPIKFTITVKNLGPSDATGVRMTDILNPGYTYTSASPSVGTYSNLTGIWTIGNLTYNQSVNLDVIATVVPNRIPADYVNNATVTGNENDPNLNNNTVTINPAPRQLIDLEIGKTVSNATPEVGSEVTFTVTVKNNGPSNATNVIVNDLLKAGYNYISSTPSVGSYNPANGIWTIGNLNVGSQVQLTMTVSVNANLSSDEYINTATTSGAELEQNLTNNTATVVTVIPGPLADLTIVKTASSLSPSVNTNVEFTLTATNKGPSNATKVTVTDVLKAGFKFVSAIPAVGTYNEATGVWTIGDLALNATVNLKITALVNASGPYDNTAVIKGFEGDPIIENNTSKIILNTQAKPLAVDDEVKICGVSPVVIDILANDVKAVSTIVPSSVAVTKQPNNGSVNIDPSTGKATYTPNPGYAGTDEFKYTVKDANGGTSNEAVVKITVNVPIIAVNDNQTTDPNTPAVINILSNDIVGSSSIVASSIIITQQPTNGTISIDATGKVTYTPNNNYVGIDSFKYTVKDVNGCTSNIATVTVQMNDLPKIGLAKSAKSVVKQQNGSYNITYNFIVGNYGTSIINEVSIKDDLRNTFKGDQFTVKGITSLGSLRINSQYNGTTILEMLAPGSSLIVGDKQQIEIVVNVVVGADKVTYLNSANAEGKSISGIKTTDISTDGIKPDNGGDVSSSIPTPVDLTRPKEFIPEGFSPNRDGMNDTFVISNVGNKRVDLEIYNRWGNIVYKNANYKNDWAGESNQGIRVGSELPEGTYFYIIVLDGKDKYAGSITLKR